MTLLADPSAIETKLASGETLTAAEGAFARKSRNPLIRKAYAEREVPYDQLEKDLIFGGIAGCEARMHRAARTIETHLADHPMESSADLAQACRIMSRYAGLPSFHYGDASAIGQIQRLGIFQSWMENGVERGVLTEDQAKDIVGANIFGATLAAFRPLNPGFYDDVALARAEVDPDTAIIYAQTIHNANRDLPTLIEPCIDSINSHKGEPVLRNSHYEVKVHSYKLPDGYVPPAPTMHLDPEDIALGVQINDETPVDEDDPPLSAEEILADRSVPTSEEEFIARVDLVEQVAADFPEAAFRLTADPIEVAEKPITIIEHEQGLSEPDGTFSVKREVDTLQGEFGFLTEIAPVNHRHSAQAL